jgi:serine protease AprX
LEKGIDEILGAVAKWQEKRSDAAMQDLESGKRFIALAVLILWAKRQKGGSTSGSLTSEQQIRQILAKKITQQVAAELKGVFYHLHEPKKRGLIWALSLNRRASPALTKSVPAVKADAARTLFTVDCSEIVWAAVDSGVDASHEAFRAKSGSERRVKRSFDFTTIREIMSLDNAMVGSSPI